MGLLDKIKQNKTEKKSADEKKAEDVSKSAVEKKPASSPSDDAKKKPAKKAAAKKPATTGVRTQDAYRILLRPMLSEKTTMQEGRGQYTFVVADTATKVQVKDAVKAVYGIRPAKVNMMHVEGKSMRFGKYRGRRSDFKKAVVIMPKGTKIDIHEGV